MSTQSVSRNPPASPSIFHGLFLITLVSLIFKPDFWNAIPLFAEEFDMCCCDALRHNEKAHGVQALACFLDQAATWNHKLKLELHALFLRLLFLLQNSSFKSTDRFSTCLNYSLHSTLSCTLVIIIDLFWLKIFCGLFSKTNIEDNRVHEENYRFLSVFCDFRGCLLINLP